MSLSVSIRLFLPRKDIVGFDAAEGLAVAFIPLVNRREDFNGRRKSEVWVGMETTVREQGLLTGELSIKQVNTMQFVEEINPR